MIEIDWPAIEDEWDAVRLKWLEGTLFDRPLREKDLVELNRIRDEFWAERGGRDLYFQSTEEIVPGWTPRSLRRRYLKEVSNEVPSEEQTSGDQTGN